jgi:hypothetical protein
VIARGLCFTNDACQLWQADTEEDLCPAIWPLDATRWLNGQYKLISLRRTRFF